jgi:N-methylhydantoinase A
MSGATVVGVDVGGTFTDILVLDEAAGAARTAKVPSTRTREAAGFLAGLGAAAVAPAEVGAIVHGTTVGTNALLERTGARCGLIATAGFGDVLDMRRRDRPRTWGLRGDFEPVIPRDLRVEVAERVGADGAVVVGVDPDEVAEAARTLRARGATALIVAFVNAYANDANERAAVAAARAEWPNEHVAASSAILGEIREFERTSTTALNGYLQPVVGAYLQALEEGLGDAGFGGPLLVVQSNGGVMTAAEARRLPVRTTLSGPAAGVIAAARCAAEAGVRDVITCDMGGTSFDVALVAGGRAAATQQATVDFGLVVRTPMIEITTIGAGGGSLARVDAGGLLRVGPESAGSDPGPVSYGRGGERPTVTDANLVLGRIDGERPLGEGLGRHSRRTSASRWGSTPSARPPRWWTSPTRASPARSGSSPSSAATTRGASRSCRSAARAACTSAR